MSIRVYGSKYIIDTIYKTRIYGNKTQTKYYNLSRKFKLFKKKKNFDDCYIINNFYLFLLLWNEFLREYIFLLRSK